MTAGKFPVVELTWADGGPASPDKEADDIVDIGPPNKASGWRVFKKKEKLTRTSSMRGGQVVESTKPEKRKSLSRRVLSTFSSSSASAKAKRAKVNEQRRTAAGDPSVLQLQLEQARKEIEAMRLQLEAMRATAGKLDAAPSSSASR